MVHFCHGHSPNRGLLPHWHAPSGALSLPTRLCPDGTPDALTEPIWASTEVDCQRKEAVPVMRQERLFHEVPGEGSGPRAVVGPADRASVLIVDDEELVGRAIALILGEQCDVTLATSARAAIERLSAGERYDLILCDLLMPVMTGMEFHAEVRRRWPDAVPSMVFMTGGASTTAARAFLADCANRCIEKPIDSGELRELVRSRAGARARQAPS